ncbi:hypothetical protein K435DRAFT_650132 [Dendrothele bispora CBS 962.96]|uniref:AB hydrolase-1 domain-containing protein n=1 Tax=Dendrothele bispora (strain CBS 962.96) TaxID=1314807 RepID=A0A4S8MM86_DENBC|nr:hypothetical protein K435DRAFT_650132 [Dendrothele bispora CBS 962.96]
MFDSQTYTLPNGINIFFTDSGAPPNSDDYTTVVVLHGSAFNGSTFDKIHDYAHKYNIRVVVWNRRDYRGSTELTDAEIDDLNKGKKSFLDMLAAQMADFLKLLIEKEKIPRVQNNAGGIALMGWSMGAASTMPFFADPAVIKPEIYEILEPYVKNLILLDPPATAIGYQEISTQKIYDPWYDPEYKTPAEQFQNFCSWVSSYYEHPDLESYPPVFNEHKGDMTNATITKWSKEEFDKFYDEKAAVRSEYGM